MGDGLGLRASDLYPGFVVDTSTSVVPDVDDKEALNEDTKTAEKATVSESSRFGIFIGIAILIALVVFLGSGK